jgi:transposase
MNCRAGCPLAAEIVGIPGVRVLSAHHEGDATSGVLRVVVETDVGLVGCRSCGVLAVAHGRRVRVLHDVPFGHRQVRLSWRQRLWRCEEPLCPVRTWTEEHDLAPPRGRLTHRAVSWAADALAEDDTTVSALARRLGVDWHTLWASVRAEARRRAADPARLDGVIALGVDEHVWRPGKFGQGREVTCMVDLTRDAAGQVRARLLDLVPGRSGTAYAAWLDARTEAFRAGVKHAALDPFRGYANALRDSLSEAVQVLDAFHVVKLGTQVLDEVRRRVQQATTGRRGHREDPLYKIRGLLRHGAENLTDRQQARLTTGLETGDPDGEVAVAYGCYQLLRSIYTSTGGQAAAEKVLEVFHTCPIPEVARLGRTLRSWREQVLAYFTTGGVSNGGTEAINLQIEKARRLAHGYRNFTNYRLRLLLAAGGTRPYRRARLQAG